MISKKKLEKFEKQINFYFKNKENLLKALIHPSYISESKLKKTADFENKAVQYIYRGVEYFKSKVKDPKFLIWSNNFENLNKYFDPKTFIFVKNKDENKVFLDFFLMCQCKYFIVGSTSFHWWPAWLCNSKEKIVLCPKEQELNLSSNANFWPESWIKI